MTSKNTGPKSFSQTNRQQNNDAWTTTEPTMFIIILPKVLAKIHQNDLMLTIVYIHLKHFPLKTPGLHAAPKFFALFFHCSALNWSLIRPCQNAPYKGRRRDMYVPGIFKPRKTIYSHTFLFKFSANVLLSSELGYLCRRQKWRLVSAYNPKCTDFYRATLCVARSLWS